MAKKPTSSAAPREQRRREPARPHRERVAVPRRPSGRPRITHAVGEAPDAFERADTVARHAACEYLSALCDPIGQPPTRAPDLFAFPTAVWKSTLVKRVKVQSLPGSGSAAPNYGVLGIVTPMLVEKLTVGNAYAAGFWSGSTPYFDPSYTSGGGGVSNDTVIGYRATAMSVRFTCSASALNAAGSLRVLCLTGRSGDVANWGGVVGKPWGVLDATNACVADPRGSDLGDKQYCWSWANTNDMTYRIPAFSTQFGPIIVFELGTESAAMELVVQVTTHYQGIPSPQQAMLMPTKASSNATWTHVDEAIAAAALTSDSGTARTEAPELEEGKLSGLDDGWSSRLARGVDRLAKEVSPATHELVSSMRHAMTPLAALFDFEQGQGQDGDGDDSADDDVGRTRPAGSAAWDLVSDAAIRSTPLRRTATHSRPGAPP